VTLCMTTNNKSIFTTTLHSAMNLNMLCMSKNINLEINFVTDRTGIQKYIKSSERLVWLDYGVSIDLETLKRFMDEFPEGYKVLVAPCVTDEIDWDLFKKKTLEGSDEPVHQRGLRFDTVTTPASKKINDNTLADFVSSSTDCRVFAIDCKAVQKKLRDADTPFKSFEHLKKIGVKIGVLRSCTVLCHYVYESIGNILESSGVRTGP
jgi:hypothetical protein